MSYLMVDKVRLSYTRSKINFYIMFCFLQVELSTILLMAVPMCGGDETVKICNIDQTTSNLKWILRTHIEISKTYPSKLRLYCVEKEKGKKHLAAS